MENFPLFLIMIRFMSGPTLIVGHYLNMHIGWYIVTLIVGFLSDVFDGIIARILGIATNSLRLLDSWADITFYTCMFLVAYLRYGSQLHGLIILVALLVLVDSSRYIFDKIKFGKRASYHMYSAKACGLLLFAGFAELFYTDRIGVILYLALILGVFTDLECFAASIVLSRWQTDVPSIYHAVKLEKARNSSTRNFVADP